MAQRQDHYDILVINPGSTSTKVSLFHDVEEAVSASIQHAVEELEGFRTTMEQAELREGAIRRFMHDNGIDPASLAAVIGRGGLMRSIPSGVYTVNPSMIADLSSGRFGEHASNLGGVLAARVARDAGAGTDRTVPAGCPAFIADPVVVDELDDVARYSGIPEIQRKSIFHALNQKSAAREAASRIGKSYEQTNLIVAHLGGGVSVGAHRLGRVVDVNNALDGDGPFAPERAGGLPAGQLVELAQSGTLTKPELKKRLTGKGGVVAYCGTNNLGELVARMDGGDRLASEVFEAMAYQVSKEIAMHGATLEGKVDLIVLTGGMAHQSRFVDAISRRVSFLAPIEIVPGEREMISLARAAWAVLTGVQTAQTY